MADWEIPLSPEDVTIDWLQRTLQKSLQTQVEVRQLVTIKTDGYLSTACQAKIKQCNKDEEEKLFLKITLPSQDPFQSFISTHNVDLNEVNVYRKTLPALIDFEKSKLNYSRLEKILPRFYAGGASFEKDKRGFFLVLEDLSENFGIFENKKGLTIERLFVAIEEIAYVHALSYAYGRANGIRYDEESNVKFIKFMEDENLVNSLDNCFKLFISDLQSRNADESVVKAAQKFAKNYETILPIVLSKEDGRFFTHGDYWSNNVMYDKNNAVKLIDWQLATAIHPSFDFSTIALCNCAPDLAMENLDRMYNAYYNTFAQSCTKLGLENPPFTLPEFIADSQTIGLPVMLGLFIFFYDPICHVPEMSVRFQLVFELCIKYNPELFA